MDYQQTIDFMFAQTPMFQQIGAAAYKPGLDSVRALAQAFGNPEQQLRCIHVGGTNGKGSTSHSLAAVLQSAGYKVGLFTSPHLIDFRERIRINGEKIPKSEVIDYIEECRSKGILDRVKPSFFELTTIMAFSWFARQKVDVAVIEVGLGGRLDSTNIISPLLSVITNISFDHTAQLGNTLAAIASEKAGIIKSGVPAVIGEAEGEVAEVFRRKAHEVDAPLFFAAEELPGFCESCEITPEGISAQGNIFFSMPGNYQVPNLRTILTALKHLRQVLPFTDEAIHRGLADVQGITGLLGRWMKLSDSPLTICDTGHNIGGWEYLGPRLAGHKGKLVMVIGFVNDKDISHILPLMPPDATYIFTRASVQRALPAEKLSEEAARHGLKGQIAAEGVQQALELARKECEGCHDAMIFVGGSTFIVADALAAMHFH